MSFDVDFCARCGWWDLVYREDDMNGNPEEDSYYHSLIDELPPHRVERLNEAALRNELALYSDRIYSLPPRRVEALIAGIFKNVLDCEVELTAATRDGGKDLVCFSSAIGKFLVEIKRYAPEHKVAVELVRQLLGVMYLDQVNCAMLVTTSDFTAPARAAAAEVTRRGELVLELKDMANIRDWLQLAFRQYFDLAILDAAIQRIAYADGGRFPRSFKLSDGQPLNLESAGA